MDLPDRPRAETFTVQELVREALRGRLRVPSFQRSLRWDTSDVARLLDSLYRGYPVGSLLLWRGRAVPEGPAMLGPVQIPQPERDEVRWIVDGQQRVTALALALTDRGQHDPRFRISFDPDTRTFHATPSSGAPSHWMSVHRLLDASALGERLLTWGSGTPERRRALLEAGARIREYVIPTYVVTSDSEEPLREVFRRLNRFGRRMEETEVFDALADPGQKLADLAPLIAQQRWGEVDPNTLLKAKLVDAGLDPTRKLDKHDLAVDEVARRARELGAGVVQAISFLRDEAGIPHAKLLPYETPLLFLPTVFRRVPQPTARSRRLLRRWVWRSFFLSRPSDPAFLRQIAKAVRDPEDDEDTLVARLIALTPRTAGEPWTIQPTVQARSDSAHTRLGYLALVHLGPTDLLTGRPVDVAALIEGDWPPPKVFSGLRGDGSSTLANRILCPPWQPRSELAQALERIGAALPQHAIDPAAFERLRADDQVGFLEARAAAIQRATRSMIASRAEWDADDRPSLRSIFAA